MNSAPLPDGRLRGPWDRVVRRQAIHDAEAQQRGEDRCVEERLRDVAFDQPPVMHHTENSDDIDESAQVLPALAAKPLHHAIGGSHRKRDQQQEGAKSKGDERSLQNIFPDGCPIGRRRTQTISACDAAAAATTQIAPAK